MSGRPCAVNCARSWPLRCHRSCRLSLKYAMTTRTNGCCSMSGGLSLLTASRPGPRASPCSWVDHAALQQLAVPAANQCIVERASGDYARRFRRHLIARVAGFFAKNIGVLSISRNRSLLICPVNKITVLASRRAKRAMWIAFAPGHHSLAVGAVDFKRFRHDVFP